MNKDIPQSVRVRANGAFELVPCAILNPEPALQHFDHLVLLLADGGGFAKGAKLFCNRSDLVPQSHLPQCPHAEWAEHHAYLPSRHPHRQSAPACNCNL